ncbi:MULTISPECIES: contact-dependent growth inhibition system immunity protein [unclassified Rhizobium]|uniref:contact-dependent growth inhibition system immunity protein n=1 Tax=unclassified Rhizobium TaxID=2613769 RepID=UPI0014930510|nr:MULTISPECIES: contact-dependent growth inhibition system immunity protein [unclassified Rhizobium]NNU68303.1 hypothetical protein [Rhizobium sp. WYCCWR 11152]NYT30621.1 hypothetical protein [Rhizobium sp. WYCCWR 11128]
MSKQLLGSYFHQDFLDEFGSEQAAFSAIRDHECVSLPIVTEELKGLLESRIDEQQLGELLFSQIGVYFDPASRGCTSREWIEHAIAELNRSE